MNFCSPVVPSTDLYFMFDSLTPLVFAFFVLPSTSCTVLAIRSFLSFVLYHIFRLTLNADLKALHSFIHSKRTISQLLHQSVKDVPSY